MFSQYCLSFDVIHVMLGCYVCSCDLKVVANWALDLMARVCRGQFFWKRYASNELVQTMQHLLNTAVSYRHKTDLYYVVREIRRGNAAENLSTFLQNYLLLEMLVREKFQVPETSPDVLRMATTQLFPAVLFEDYKDQLGFIMALGHVASHIDKTGQVKKGTYATAKKIHKIVNKFIEKIQKFDVIEIPWTMDTLHLFLLSEPHLEQDIVEISRLVLTQESDE
ncbi:uncharacterized protein CEXT_201381 [Caerostris extrusa]|uniref:Uncharacterized protein n=1 Tax=Caerostris extrusa TaxID=172846 RepID=A0AAV4NXT4_CAEEX|nr:uncharacterized protein CEXT_201381 [Caerostris extrusa]